MGKLNDDDVYIAHRILTLDKNVHLQLTFIVSLDYGLLLTLLRESSTRLNFQNKSQPRGSHPCA